MEIVISGQELPKKLPIISNKQGHERDSKETTRVSNYFLVFQFLQN